MRYAESARIVQEAVRSTGGGQIGLARLLKKAPSLVSKYAKGEVRPKAETLLKCLTLISTPNGVTAGAEVEAVRQLAYIRTSVTNLSPTADTKLIMALFNVIKCVEGR